MNNYWLVAGMFQNGQTIRVAAGELSGRVGWVRYVYSLMDISSGQFPIIVYLNGDDQNVSRMFPPSMLEIVGQ